MDENIGGCTEKIEPVDLTEVDNDATALIINIMQQNAKDAAYTTNALLEGYKRDYERAEATVQAIRRAILNLFDGPYAPSQNSIIAALYPDVDY